MSGFSPTFKTKTKPSDAFFSRCFLMDLFLIALFPEVIPFLKVILRLQILMASLFQQPPWPDGDLRILRETEKQQLSLHQAVLSLCLQLPPFLWGLHTSMLLLILN